MTGRAGGARWRSRWAAWAMLGWLVLLAGALVAVLRGGPALGGGVSWAGVVATVSAAGSLVTALGTVSAVVLAWRQERRDADEFRQRLAELEAARLRLESARTDGDYSGER